MAIFTKTRSGVGMTESAVFGKADVKVEGVIFKNPNQYREAVIYEALTSLPESKIREFVESEEADTMLNNGIISQDTIDRLVDAKNNEILNTTICHMAKEENDPLWDEFVKLRIEERRVMNELIEKYGEEAKPYADKAKEEFVESYIPKYFHNK